MAYFVHNLDSTRLMLHFYIFTWGSAQRYRTFSQDDFFCPQSGLEMANFTFTFLHFTILHGDLIKGPESDLKAGYFI